MAIKETIRETINSKYNFTEPVVNGKVLHYADYNNPLELLYSSNQEAVVLSPNSLNFMNESKVVPTEEFLNLATNRYDVDFEKIKNNGHRIQVIGYGGFMSNMFHFINLINKNKNIPSTSIFSMEVFETDKFSAMNNVRTFVNTSNILSYYESKLDLTINSFSYYVNTRNRYYTESSIHTRALIVGSPDFQTREMLEGNNFLFFGNSNSDFVVHKSPVIDAGMTRETYGKINIVEFWVGILETTYWFLKLLEDNSPRELRAMPHNTEMWSRNIREEKAKEATVRHREPEAEWSPF